MSHASKLQIGFASQSNRVERHASNGHITAASSLLVATRRPWRYACRLLYYCAQNSTRIMSCPRVPFHRMPRCNSAFLSVCGLSVMVFFYQLQSVVVANKSEDFAHRSSDRQTRGLVQQTPGFSLLVALSWQRPLPPHFPPYNPSIPSPPHPDSTQF